MNYDCTANIEDMDYCNGHCETCMHSILVYDEPEDYEDEATFLGVE